MDLKIAIVKAPLKFGLVTFLLLSNFSSPGQQTDFHDILHLFQRRHEPEFESNPSLFVSKLGFHAVDSKGKHILSYQNEQGDYLNLIKKKQHMNVIKYTAARDTVFAGWVKTLIIDGYKLTRQFVNKNNPYSLYWKDGIEITVSKKFNYSPQIEYSLEIRQAIKNFE